MSANAEFLPRLWQGVDYFNREYYFEAHDIFEELWMVARGPSKRFYQGLVQIATGCYHQAMDNRKGALSQLQKGIEKLEGFAPVYLGIDVGRLLAAAGEMAATLQQGSTPERFPVIAPK